MKKATTTATTGLTDMHRAIPEQAAGLARKKDHARADAMLIAFFGMRCAS